MHYGQNFAYGHLPSVKNGLPNCEVFPMRTFYYIGYTAVVMWEINTYSRR